MLLTCKYSKHIIMHAIKNPEKILSYFSKYKDIKNYFLFTGLNFRKSSMLANMKAEISSCE